MANSLFSGLNDAQSTVAFPETIKSNVHAQIFYGVLSTIFDSDESMYAMPELSAENSVEITKIIEKHSRVDWMNNKTIHERISRDIDDLVDRYEKECGLAVSFDTVDKMIESVKTVVQRRC